jgi:hypothetical protein
VSNGGRNGWSAERACRARAEAAVEKPSSVASGDMRARSRRREGRGAPSEAFEETDTNSILASIRARAFEAAAMEPSVSPRVCGRMRMRARPWFSVSQGSTRG